MSIFLKKPQKPEPLIINNKIGTFILRDPQRDNYYEGEIILLGEKHYINLEPDSEDKKTAYKALGHLHKFVSDAEKWDRRIKEYITENFVEDDGMVDIWGGTDPYDKPSRIKKEEFYSRLSFGFACIYKSGELGIDYDPDEMFTDHGIFVSANISGEILSANLYG